MELNFSDMKLRLGDRLQLQDAAGEKNRYLIKVVGYLDRHSLIVTFLRRNGNPLTFLEQQPFIVRGFSGKHAFAFETHLLKSYPDPYPHLHLASPKRVEQKEIRGSERVSCNIAVSVIADGNTEKRYCSAVMMDLSITGTKIAAMKPLGEKGGMVALTFRSRRNISDDYLTLRGILRCINFDARDDGVLHGVEFVELQNSDRLALENMLYRLRFEADVNHPSKYGQSASESRNTCSHAELARI